LIVLIVCKLIRGKSYSEISFESQSLLHKLLILFELMDIAHFTLGLRGTTAIEVFRIISHQLITWLIVIPHSRIFCWYILIVCIHLCIKYAFLASVAFNINAAHYLKGLRYRNFYINFILEFVLGNLSILEYLISVW